MAGENVESGRLVRSAHPISVGLGWFSVGLGLAEVLIPRKLTQALGMRDGKTLLRAYGLREMAAGVGILSSSNRVPWLWGRLAGDALDIATLIPQLRARNRRRNAAGLALAAVAGITALDMACARALKRSAQAATRDYSDRVGMPASPDAMRGAARDFLAPRDMRIPEALRPYTLP